VSRRRSDAFSVVATHPTLFGEMTGRAGLADAVRAVGFCVDWALAEKELGVVGRGGLNLSSYSEWKGQSRMVTWREQNALERCFPGHRTPTGVLPLLHLDVGGKSREAVTVEFVSLPGLAV
jgi:hypothetical protein